MYHTLPINSRYHHLNNFKFEQLLLLVVDKHITLLNLSTKRIPSNFRNLEVKIGK